MRSKIIMICVIIALTFTACGKGTTEEQAKQKIDVDLTSLSSTMVYSEVYHMVNEPKDYMRKTIKMSGAFNVYKDEMNNEYHYACIIKDATKCCAQGIEFVPEGNLQYPEDFPKDGEEITVIGVMSEQAVGEASYCLLKKASLENSESK